MQACFSLNQDPICHLIPQVVVQFWVLYRKFDWPLSINCRSTGTKAVLHIQIGQKYVRFNQESKGSITLFTSAFTDSDLIHVKADFSLHIKHTAITRSLHIKELAILDDYVCLILGVDKNGSSGEWCCEILKEAVTDVQWGWSLLVQLIEDKDRPYHLSTDVSEATVCDVDRRIESEEERLVDESAHRHVVDAEVDDILSDHQWCNLNSCMC